VWQVREVAYEVEDIIIIIDEFLHLLKDREYHISDFIGIAKDFVNLPKNITARRQISSKLPKIKAKVQCACYLREKQEI
jgi:hypothetical protein